MEHRTSKNDFDFSLQRPSGSDSAAVATQDQQRPVSTVELQPPNAFSGASCESALATMMRPQFSDMVSIDADTAVSLTNAPYRWWEDEAQPILWAFNIADINRLLRFRLYDNDEFPKMILQLRNTDTLSEFVIALVPGSMPGLLGLTHQEKVDEIIRLCRPNHFAPPWNWIPSYLNEMYPAKLAMEINIESILQFRAVPFEDWVRYALGYPTLSVVWFLEQHMQLYKLVSEYLSKYPERYHIYVEAEKHLRSCCPWAHYALLQCLREKGLANPNLQPNQSIADFLIVPIRALFKTPSWPFVDFLKKLSVLSIRFVRRYHESPEINWTLPFDTNTVHLDKLIPSGPATVLARRLTHSDQREFSGFSVRCFDQGCDSQLQLLVGSWHELSTSVEECCIAFPDMPNYFQECVKALLDLKNYYSATAMLYGMQEAQISSIASLSHPSGNLSSGLSLDLLDPTDNYGIYRKQITEKPGLPFLHPHISDYQNRGQGAVAHLFPFSVM